MVEKKEDLAKQIEMLNVRIAALEEELKASMYREELMEKKTKRVKKESWLRNRINDESSKVGKVVRAPRTFYRLVSNPDVREDFRNKRKGITSGEGVDKKIDIQEERPLKFAPLCFFYTENKDFRVNLVLDKFEKEDLKRAIDFSNRNKCALRIITYGIKDPQIEYKAIAKKFKLPAIDEISFYDATGQAKRSNPFRLEVGENDVFLTRAWQGDEE